MSPTLGLENKDWPDLDIDSNASDYEEKSELAEAAFLASNDRSIANRRNRRPPQWDRIQSSQSKILSLVPEAANRAFRIMQTKIWDYDVGYFSDEQLITQPWNELDDLQSAAGPLPSTYEPLNELIHSLETLRRESVEGQVATKDVVMRSKAAVSKFDAATVSALCNG